MNTVKITAIAPTFYQKSSLSKFGMTVQEIGNGSFLSEQVFGSEEEAKDYLTNRAEMYYDEFEGQVDEHLAEIEKYGFLRIDAVTAKIEELETETKFVLAFDSGAKGTRYIDDMDEKNGTSFSDSAKVFESKEEAQKFNDDKGYLCWIEEIEVYQN